MAVRLKKPRLSGFNNGEAATISIFSRLLNNLVHLPSRRCVRHLHCNFGLKLNMSMPRTAAITRNTNETQIRVSINLDGSGQQKLNTGVPFLDHMLDQIARHGLIDLDIEANGDLHIDAHHTVEDVGITFGQAFAKAIGDKKGIRRYGHAYVPLDEALSRVVIDFSGRPGLEFHVPFKRAMIGGFDVDLTHEFFQGFVNHALVSLHIDNLRGENAHHQCETVFKAFGRALRMAAELDPRSAGTIPSTKGSL
jgi:imidazoleglycerol-phosphate dehydratase